MRIAAKESRIRAEEVFKAANEAAIKASNQTMAYLEEWQNIVQVVVSHNNEGGKKERAEKEARIATEERAKAIFTEVELMFAAEEEASLAAKKRIDDEENEMLKDTETEISGKIFQISHKNNHGNVHS